MTLLLRRTYGPVLPVVDKAVRLCSLLGVEQAEAISLLDLLLELYNGGGPYRHGAVEIRRARELLLLLAERCAEAAGAVEALGAAEQRLLPRLEPEEAPHAEGRMKAARQAIIGRLHVTHLK